MTKKHDENKDLRSFSRIGKVSYYDKTLQASKKAIIGIHLWGKIDYLTKHCGWSFYWNNDIVTVNNQSDDDTPKKRFKKDKTHNLTNKTRRQKDKV